ncbi:unnamed protein product [Effrenium voratum]|uniref:Uncharacterized protein n=1 Tax=Effrenium voratum TaxID=2562239 RepID=A0AA36J4U5_9DINO|nr:unnamed protein product [Effrenium voratum]CAJ1399117.1 unnamed protein product [Effrenium voratum]CAJ1426107.1 unnamed protein product [Effrenium voratum]
MRIARPPDKAQERFGAVAVLPKAKVPLRPRVVDSNDSGTIWQVVFRQVDPIDPQRGPWLPVCEEIVRKEAGEGQLTRAAGAAVPQGLRRLPLPWEPMEFDEIEAPRMPSGVRRTRTVSSTPPAFRPKKGHGLWKRLAEPRSARSHRHPEEKAGGNRK